MAKAYNLHRVVLCAVFINVGSGGVLQTLLLREVSLFTLTYEINQTHQDTVKYKNPVKNDPSIPSNERHQDTTMNEDVLEKLLQEWKMPFLNSPLGPNVVQGIEAHCMNLDAVQFMNNPKCSGPILQRTHLLHLGKAGGGTVRSFFGGGLNQCHPRPCRPVENLFATKKLLILTMRDPIDRFVSAFYYQLLKDCHPTNETRIASDLHAVLQDPFKYCMIRGRTQEALILHVTYQGNVNYLAHDLCQAMEQQDLSDFPDPWRNAKQIKHAKSPLAEWLEPYYEVKRVADKINQTAKTRHFKAWQTWDQPFYEEKNWKDMPRPLLWALALERLNKNATTHPSFTEPLTYEDQVVRLGDLLRQNKNIPAGNYTTPRYSRPQHVATHSSMASGHSPPKLDEYGTCCMARYLLAKDYALLQAILDHWIGGTQTTHPAHKLLDQWKFTLRPELVQLCSWGAPLDQVQCVLSIQSMVQRRLQYLGDQTCQQISR